MLFVNRMDNKEQNSSEKQCCDFGDTTSRALTCLSSSPRMWGSIFSWGLQRTHT